MCLSWNATEIRCLNIVWVTGYQVWDATSISRLYSPYHLFGNVKEDYQLIFKWLASAALNTNLTIHSSTPTAAMWTILPSLSPALVRWLHYVSFVQTRCSQTHPPSTTAFPTFSDDTHSPEIEISKFRFLTTFSFQKIEISKFPHKYI